MSASATKRVPDAGAALGGCDALVEALEALRTTASDPATLQKKAKSVARQIDAILAATVVLREDINACLVGDTPTCIASSVYTVYDVAQRIPQGAKESDRAWLRRVAEVVEHVECEVDVLTSNEWFSLHLDEVVLSFVAQKKKARRHSPLWDFPRDWTDAEHRSGSARTQRIFRGDFARWNVTALLDAYRIALKSRRKS